MRRSTPGCWCLVAGRCLVPAPAAGRGAGRVLPARRGGTRARGLGRSPGVVLRRGCRRAAPPWRPRVAPREAGDASAAFRALLQAPTSPRSSARVARPPTCWSGRPTCGMWLQTPPTTLAMPSFWSAPATPATGWGGAQEGYRLLRAARDLVSPERDPLWASRLTRRVAATAFDLGESLWATTEARTTSRGAVECRPGQQRARRSPGPAGHRRVVGRADRGGQSAHRELGGGGPPLGVGVRHRQGPWASAPTCG